MSNGLNKKQIEFLNKYTKGTWSYDPATGLVDVEGNFNCSRWVRKELMTFRPLEDFKGIKFGKVSGLFTINSNKFTSLEGSPQKVGGDFDCSNNQLTSLEGAPQEVCGSFSCAVNNLTSLEGAPKKVGVEFSCSKNKLKNLKGGPQEVGGGFHCQINELTSLEGAPQKVGGWFKCDVFELKKGEWNLNGWLNVLKEGSQEARELITILLPAEELNKEIQKDPAGMIMKLKDIWNDADFKEIRAKIVLPKGYQDDMDLVGDMSDVGF